MPTTQPPPRFPDDFWWGSATASYQVEGAVSLGGRGPSIWDTFAHTPGRVAGGDTGDVAVDHYHRLAEDVALMEELNLDAYRFSIAWPRIQPTGTGPANPEGLAFYADLVDRLLAAGIKPVVTLYHWDLPQALQDAGGWANRATAHAFADYARIVAAHLGDRVALWTTINEPWCVAHLGHVTGEHAPGLTDRSTVWKVAHHLNLAHGLAARAITEELGPRTPVSITLNLQVTHAASDAAADVGAKRTLDLVNNEIFLGPLLEGAYPAGLVELTRDETDWSFVEEGDLDLCRVPLASLGVNYYTAATVRAGADGGIEHVESSAPTTAMGWPIHPASLTGLLTELHDRFPQTPLLITENGAAFDDTVDADGAVHDPDRIAYLREHVLAVADAMAAGADVRGYFVWSLLDNFEWAHGYAKRFGVIHVDHPTLTRTVKDSGRWWAELAASGRVPGPDLTERAEVASVAPLPPRRARDLGDGWEVRAVGGPVPHDLVDAVVPATVPGSVHTDLMAAGLIEDPYVDDHEATTAWVGLVDWQYSTTLTLRAEEVAAHLRHDLVFDGLDTVASVEVNGTPLGTVDNMYRTWRFEVSDVLRPGDNRLSVRFASPVRHANAAALALGPRPHTERFPFNAVRKLASSFGWDWGPCTATSGIWRPVRLESWTSRLADVRTDASLDGTDGVLRVRAEIQHSSEDPAPGLDLVVRVDGQETTVAVHAATHDVELRVADVDRWWPVGHGDPVLYDVQVALRQGSAVIDEVTRRVGFRSVHWDSTPDEDGTPFALRVNDQPVYVKGVNWITDDAFPHRVTRQRCAERLDQALSAHVNLVRVWGGGLYESDDFFELCDERGILTWQDFLFSCAAYADEEPLRSSVASEVRDNVLRIAHHPSLVLLNGTNECLMGYEEWGWQELLDGRSWGEHYYRTLLPALTRQYAPQVPYTPGSPFSPGGHRANDPEHGSCHLWEMWNGRDWLDYRLVRPRFVAEFGWQGPPTWTTLRSAVHDEPLTPESPGMLSHQKAESGLAKLSHGLVPHLRIPSEIDDWHWAMQVNQAAALRAALTHFRALAPLNAGAVIWQLNDCWPVISWSLVDGAGRPKPALDAVRAAFAPRLVTLQPAEGGLVVSLVNDQPDAWEATVVLRRLGVDGTVLAEETVRLGVDARGIAHHPVGAAVARADDHRRELVVADVDGLRDTWWFAEPRDTELPVPSWVTSLHREEGGWSLALTPDVVARDVCLLVDKIADDASVDTGLVTVLPGETHTFRLHTDAPVTPDQVTARGVLRCVNQLIQPPATPGRKLP